MKYQINTEEEAYAAFEAYCKELNISFDRVEGLTVIMDIPAESEAFDVWLDTGQKDGIIDPDLFYPY